MKPPCPTCGRRHGPVCRAFTRRYEPLEYGDHAVMRLRQRNHEIEKRMVRRGAKRTR